MSSGIHCGSSERSSSAYDARSRLSCAEDCSDQDIGQYTAFKRTQDQVSLLPNSEERVKLQIPDFVSRWVWIKLDEGEFDKRISSALSTKLPKYKVVRHGNLLYKMIIDGDGKVQPVDISDPSRGQLAFQTDIMIRNDRVPLVVLETKYGGFSTHDVLTYSGKAVKHKEVYPYLRYGLIVGGEGRISKKFFVHNSGFDFAMAMNDVNTGLIELVEIVNKQIKAAEQMLAVLMNRPVRRFVSYVEIA
jgi:hypothetical protein